MKTFKELVNDFNALQVLMENNYMPIDAVNSMFSKMGRSKIGEYFYIPRLYQVDAIEDYHGHVYANYKGQRILYRIVVTADLHTPNKFVFYVEDPVLRKKLWYKLRKIRNELEICNNKKEDEFAVYSKSLNGSKMRLQQAMRGVIESLERAMDRQYLTISRSTPSNLDGESNFVFQHFNTRKIVRATICPENLKLDIYAEDERVQIELMDRLDRLTNINELTETYNMCRTMKVLRG